MSETKDGSLRIWIFRGAGVSYTSVSSVEQAKDLIRQNVAADLKEDSDVVQNAFGLEIYEDIGNDKLEWSEWNDDGFDIMEILDDEGWEPEDKGDDNE